jgi:hypothetical protein
MAARTPSGPSHPAAERAAIHKRSGVKEESRKEDTLSVSAEI